MKDDEAYWERLAILELENPGKSMIELIEIATDNAFHTPLSLAMTDAANGDWRAVERICARAEELKGKAAAEDVRRDIEGKVAAAVEQRNTAAKKGRRKL